MFRLIKLLIGLVGVALFVWFGANVPLGSHTLFEHLQAIGRTRETQDLLDGTRQSAQPLVDNVRRRLGGTAAESNDDATAAHAPTPNRAHPDAGPPTDEITEPDRRELRRVLGARPSHVSR